MRANDELCGLRGWLILVGIGVVISPIRLLATTLPTFIPIIKNGTWLYFIDPHCVYYNPLVIPLLAMEMTVNTAMIAALLWLNYLFFSKHRLFPKLYIGLALASLSIILLDSWFSSLVFSNSPVFDPDTTRNFVQTVVSAAIWIPYMLRSKRVKATFMQERSGNGNPTDDCTEETEPLLSQEPALTNHVTPKN